MPRSEFSITLKTSPADVPAGAMARPYSRASSASKTSCRSGSAHAIVLEEIYGLAQFQELRGSGGEPRVTHRVGLIEADTVNGRDVVVIDRTEGREQHGNATLGAAAILVPPRTERMVAQQSRRRDAGSAIH